MIKKFIDKAKCNTTFLAGLVLLAVGLVVVVYCIVREDTDTAKELLADSYDFQIRGIDISHHNSTPNWKKLEQEGVNFVYMKVTEGTSHHDTNYFYNQEAARASDIAIGAYHFYIFAESGKEQAKHFISAVKTKQGDLIPAIDVEHSPNNPYSTDTAYVNKVIRELRSLEDELHKYYGVRPIIYTNLECYALYIQKYFPDNLLWIVYLDGTPPAEIRNWRIWQFTHKGKVQGIEGKVDLNFYRYTSKEFSELLLP